MMAVRWRWWWTGRPRSTVLEKLSPWRELPGCVTLGRPPCAGIAILRNRRVVLAIPGNDLEDSKARRLEGFTDCAFGQEVCCSPKPDGRVDGDAVNYTVLWYRNYFYLLLRPWMPG